VLSSEHVGTNAPLADSVAVHARGEHHVGEKHRALGDHRGRNLRARVLRVN
jgi:hypothetical protein